MLTTRWQALAVATLLASACHEQSKHGTGPPLPAAGPPLQDHLDQWIGRWHGPEGTYLSIAKRREGYSLEIADLDGPKSYEALGVGDHLEFERNGKAESIRATDGKQTGMKWLQDKSDCLTIKTGEGFCRD